MHSLLESQVITNCLFYPEISHKAFALPFRSTSKAGRGVQLSWLRQQGADPYGILACTRLLEAEEEHSGSSNTRVGINTVFSVLWVKNSPHGNYTINHNPCNCLFESLSHYMWLPRHSSVAFLSTHQHKLTDTQFPRCIEQQCQIWHSSITFWVKDMAQKGHLWTQVGGSNGPLLPAGRGAAWMSSAKHVFFHLQESWWQAAFRAVGEDTNVYFSIMQVHSPAYFPFRRAEQIGTTGSFASLMHTWIKLESALQNRNNSQNSSQPLLAVMTRVMMSSSLMQRNLIVL